MSELHELARRIQHDLGKYATLQARWLPPDASVEERHHAVRTDLLTTSRGPDGTRDAGAIASELSAELHALGVEVDAPIRVALRALVEAVAALRDAPDASDDPAVVAAVERGRMAAEAVRTAARTFAHATRPPEPDSP